MLWRSVSRTLSGKKVSCFPLVLALLIFNSEIVLNIKKNSEISFLSLIAHSFKYLLSSIPIREDRVKRHVVFWASLVALDSLPTLCLMREAAAVQIRSSWALQTDALAPKRLGRLLIWVS